ncbi:MAG: acyl-CoA dehydrogenase family protein [Betaproteobacteria bacterium]|nr:acyl-CoA dehydrogenase family protein [Betaproteobacteria bacterium]
MIRDPSRLEALLVSTRRFVCETAIPNEALVEERDEIPEPIVDEMRRLGLFGWSIPEEYGGAGLTTEELCLANMEISRCSVAFRARCGTNTGIGAEAIIQDGTAEQKRTYLPRLASGEMTGCLAVTEPGAGSDLLGGLATTAVEDDGGFVLNGTKRYITNAPIADVFTVIARTDPGKHGASSTTTFLIERGTPGLSTGKPHKKMGQEGSPVSEVYFENCRVPNSSVLGGVPGRGFASVMKSLNKQRINLASLCTGPAIRLLDESLAHARTRRQSGKAIGEFQLVQAMLADCKVEIEAARALILDTARKRDRGEDVTLEVSMCKYYASEMCGRVADRAVQILGGAGYCEDIGGAVPRLYRDVRLFRLYEGTSQIHQLNIAKLLLKGVS